MIDVYNITGPQLRAWRKDYMKLSQEQFGELLGRSSRFVRDQEKKSGRIDTIMARACRDIQAQMSIHYAHEKMMVAAMRLEELYCFDTG